MAEPQTLFDAVAEAVVAEPIQTATRTWDTLAGRRVLVTAGPTHEPIDPVRFLGNRSSGKMGVAIATEALARGAHVTLILGPGTVAPPVGVETVHIQTAEDLRREVLACAENADVVVMAAAVADFRPKAVAETKLKKDQGVPDLVLEPTPDILAELGGRKRPGQLLVGFAAETHDVEAAGRDKLARKHADLLVANLVGREGTGFGAESNDAAIVSAAGEDVPMRSWTKAELAAALCDRLAALS
jgi:phosphopantothenoylcysteine decarboxylase/phosphopantothenate--cysteine ligase